MKDGRVLNKKIVYRARGVVWMQERSGRAGLNVKDIEKILNNNGSVSKYDYATIINLMQAAVKESNYKEAEHLCGMLVEAVPDNAQLRYLHGMLNHKLGNIDKTRQDYNYLVSKQMADASILNNLGVVYADNKQYKEAEDLFMKAVAENPGMVEIHENLASVSIRNNDLETATLEYSKVLEKEPNNINALFNLGVINMSKGDYPKAKELWHKILSISPQDEDTKKALESLKADAGNIGT